MVYKLLIASLFILLNTCSRDLDPEGIQANYGESYKIIVGKSLKDPEKGTIIKFEKVLDDSRCPKGVQCVWEGKATIRLTVADKSAQTTTYDVDNGKEATTNYGYKIIFVTLRPYPENGKYIDPKEYEAELKIEKL